MSNTAISTIGADTAAAETEANIRALDVYAKGRMSLDESTPAETLAILGRDRILGIRRRVAGNPSTPAEALAMLGKDRSW
jgi:predicted house-cleaning NTP pyrophosphatase (Maf/HAM1 superfamily)